MNHIRQAKPEDAAALAQYRVYDDSIVRGVLMLDGAEIVRLFVEPAFQGRGNGSKLLEYARSQQADHLWVLEKNPRAIRFYERHGFRLTGTRKNEEDTTEYLCLMQYGD